MRLPEILAVTSLPIILAGCFFYLLYCLKKYRQLPALAGLISLILGLFLLALDLTLISFTIGVQHIPNYLLFNRLVSDTGFAGRWVLTVYLFTGTGLGITIYLLARNLITRFNKTG